MFFILFIVVFRLPLPDSILLLLLLSYYRKLECDGECGDLGVRGGWGETDLFEKDGDTEWVYIYYYWCCCYEGVLTLGEREDNLGDSLLEGLV